VGAAGWSAAAGSAAERAPVPEAAQREPGHGELQPELCDLGFQLGALRLAGHSRSVMASQVARRYMARVRSTIPTGGQGRSSRLCWRRRSRSRARAFAIRCQPIPSARGSGPAPSPLRIASTLGSACPSSQRMIVRRLVLSRSANACSVSACRSRARRRSGPSSGVSVDAGGTRLTLTRCCSPLPENGLHRCHMQVTRRGFRAQFATKT